MEIRFREPKPNGVASRVDLYGCDHQSPRKDLARNPTTCGQILDLVQTTLKSTLETT